MSCLGYTYITNNVAQSVAENNLVSPGSVVRTSCLGNIVPTGNNSLTVRRSGVYLIDVKLIGTPTAVGTETDGTINPAILINGLVVASPSVTVTTTNYTTEFEVRVITPLNCGDVITIANLGTFTLTMNATNTQGGYNVNIVINKY